MKKRVVVASLLIVFTLLIYSSQYVHLKYNIGIMDYIRYSVGLTKEDQKILEKYQPLIYGGNINEPPLGIYYEDSGQYLGLVVDRINALSIELGVPIISQPMVWNEALSALAGGETDLCDMVPSAERAEYFVFSDPIYILRGVVVVPKANDAIHRLKDLKDMTVAAQEGDYAIEVIAEKVQVRTVQTANLSDAMNLLYNGQVDAVVGDEPVARYLLNELTYTDKYRVLDEILYENPCTFAVPKNQSDLLDVINKGIFSMKHKGVMDKIEAKWSGYHTSLMEDSVAVDKQRLNFLAAVLVLFVALILIYIWNRSLKMFAEAKTRELNIIKNELQIIFNGMDDFLVVAGKDRKVKNINGPFLKHLDLEEVDIIGKPFTSITMLEEFENKYDGILLQLLAGADKGDHANPGQKYELKYQERFYKFTIHPLGKESIDSDDILIMISDDTLARSEEQRLIHSNRMETVGQLASGVAHELRTPLGTIRNSTFLLQGESCGEDDLKTITINSINKAVERASNIIENLLKFSRLTNEERNWIDVKESILESALPSQMRMEKQDINMEILCEPDIKLFINSDSFNHIMINLIQNAVDAMPNGGKLQILCFRSGDDNRDILLKIIDNGIGIDENSVGRIFEPFYTTKPVGKGTGLGLYIVYSEVGKSNGEINVDSNINKGTTFTIRFPNGGK